MVRQLTADSLTGGGIASRSDLLPVHEVAQDHCQDLYGASGTARHHSSTLLSLLLTLDKAGASC